MKYIALILILSGCSSLTPYAAIRHQSNPQISNDGQDTICGGIKKPGRLSIKAGYCYGYLNESRNVAEVDIEYEFRGTN